MPLSLLPLTSRLRRKVGISPVWSEAADAHEVLAPELIAEAPPIIQLPGELERIVAFNKTVKPERFFEHAEAREVRHPPTVASLYRDAIILRGEVYSRGSYKVISSSSRKLARVDQPVELRNRMLTTNFTIERYFGHWLLDGISLELLAEELKRPALSVAREPWLQEPQYRALVNLMLERREVARVENLWMVDDRPMNQSRIDRLRELRRRIRSSPPTEASRAPVFLRRVAGAKRPLINQDSLCESMARRGFTVLTPEIEPVETLRSALHGARLVVSVEGSALCHAVAAMAEGGTIVAIQPPRRVDFIQKAWTDCAGLRLAQAVASDRPDGFEMEEDRLIRLIDLVARENAF